jgi:hypothetical protein
MILGIGSRSTVLDLSRTRESRLVEREEMRSIVALIVVHPRTPDQLTLFIT